VARVLVIPADPDRPIQVRVLEGESLSVLQGLVGGPVEAVDVERPDASLWVNEEGKALGLRPNLRATALLWVHNRAFRGRDFVVGDAVVGGPAGPDGDLTGVPDALVGLLQGCGVFRVEVQTFGSSGWSGNGLRFGDWLSAYVYAVELAQRWSLVAEVRICLEPC